MALKLPPKTPAAKVDQYINTVLLPALEEVLTGIVGVNTTQTALINQIVQVVAALQQAQAQAASASQQAAAAQESADAGGTAVSGANTAAVDASDAGWAFGPQVDLIGVVAGNLTLTGSGPQHDAATTASASPVDAEFRIQEIVAGVETTVFTGGAITAAVYGGSTLISGDTVDSTPIARTTTGAISYRLDARGLTPGATINDLQLYLYARRAP